MEEVQRFDLILFLIVITLVAIGNIMIFSASFVTAEVYYKDSFYFVKRQIFSFIIGLFAMLVVAMIPYNKWRKYTNYILGLAVFMLILVFVPGIGKRAGGASRWIRIGFLGFQPSEFAKLAIIFYLADLLSRKQVEIKDITKVVVPALVVLFIVAFLILMQPDLSTTLVISALTFLMLFIGNVRYLHLGFIMLIGIFGTMMLVLQKDYRLKRLTSYLNPWVDPFNTGYHITQSLVAVGSGGFLGVGLGSSKQKFFYLPEQYTDFIFAIIAEELGFLGAITIIGLFVFLFIRGIKIAWYARNLYGTLLATGLVSMICLQGLINIGVVLSAFPTTGLPLPFISYGRSDLVIKLIAVGILLNISMYKRKTRHSRVFTGDRVVRYK